MERLFEDIRTKLPHDICIDVIVNKYVSQGFWQRLYDSMRAAQRQGHINHVTGDVHYLTYFLSKKRTILTILDCVTLERLKGFKRWLYWLLWYWLPEKRCSAITVISNSTKIELLKYLKCRPEKIHVIHCPVSSEFSPSTKVFNHSCPRILQVGTSPNKNLPRIAEALEGFNCTLSIIGQISNEQLYAFTKYGLSFECHTNLSREDVVAQYHQSDIIMFASLYEGFGLPILEANATGRPVITSNIYSMPEVAGDAACYVDPYDAMAIRKAVFKIATDDVYRNQLIQTGFVNVERFRLQEISDQYARLYWKVISETCPLDFCFSQ